ncbi:MAG: NFACT family protein [Herpetosiphonaceae bacterium]|nr:NFACT family protein [Herpetosiphonaceae bacterium]
MYVDALTLNAVVAELRDTIMGGRIQRVLQPTPESIGLEVYAGRRANVLLSAHPQRARIQLTPTKLTRGGDDDSPLLLLLRKYIKSGVITAIEQPPLERIVALSITKYPRGRKDGEDDDDDVLEERRTTLLIEVLGGRSNVILLDEGGHIMDAVRRVSHDQRRPVQPHILYTPPPPQPAQGDPRTAQADQLRALLSSGPTDVAKSLTSAFRGVSPLVAREALFRATGTVAPINTPDLPFAAIAAELTALYGAPHVPSLALEGELPVAFAPYHLDQYPLVERCTSISEAMERFFAVYAKTAAHATRRAALATRLAAVRLRYERQRDALARELERARAIDDLRWEGEMIYAYLHTITPGQTQLSVEDRLISLDPAQTPVENAQARFRAYDKAKGALAGVPEHLAAAEAQLAYLDETLTLLELAEGFDAISGIEREMEQQGLLKPQAGNRSARGPRAQPLHLRSSEGLPILVGRSAGQNDEVTFRLAQPDDVWLHARGVPGAHVVIRADGAVGDQTLLEAAGLALYFSKARHQPAADVSLCRRRDVRKVAGGPPGLVTLRNEHSLHVRPLAPADIGREEQEV